VTILACFLKLQFLFVFNAYNKLVHACIKGLDKCQQAETDECNQAMYGIIALCSKV